MKDLNNKQVKVGDIVVVPELYREHGSPHPKLAFYWIQSINNDSTPITAEGLIVSGPSGKPLIVCSIAGEISEADYTTTLYEGDNFLVVGNLSKMKISVVSIMKDGGSLVLVNRNDLKKYKIDYSIGTDEKDKGLVYDMETTELISKETLKWILVSLSNSNETKSYSSRIKKEDSRYK